MKKQTKKYRMIEVWGTSGPGTVNYGKFKVANGRPCDMTRQAVAKAKKSNDRPGWTYYCPLSQFKSY